MKKDVLSPGKVLKSLIQTYQITASQLSRDLDVNISTLNALINDNGGRVNAVIALKLSKCFGTAEDYWVNLQIQHDLALAKKDADLTAVLKGIKAVKEPPKGEVTAKKGKAPRGSSREAPPLRTRRAAAEKADKPVKEARASKAKALKAEASKDPLEAPKKRGPKPKTDQAPKDTLEAPKKRGPKPKGALNEAKVIPSPSSTEEKQPLPIKDFDFSLVSSIKEKPRSRRKAQNKPAPEAAAVVEAPPREEKPRAILIKRDTNPPIVEEHYDPLIGEGESDASGNIPDNSSHEFIGEPYASERYTPPESSPEDSTDDDFDNADFEPGTAGPDSEEADEDGETY
jgi:addiction module HigA family antidote